jgi:hypothetical protein
MNTSNHHESRRVKGPVITTALRRWLQVVFVLFGLLMVDSLILVMTDVAAWWSGEGREDGRYLWAFLVHLGLGLLLIVPFIIYGVGHARRGRHRQNRRAVAVGWGLLWIAVALLVTGLVLVRVEVGGLRLGIDDSFARSVLFWVHATSPLIAIWLFILHRLVGPRLRWRVGVAWSGGGVALAAWLLFAFGSPVERPAADAKLVAMAVSSNADFAPSLLETAHDDLIPPAHLLGDDHCISCHADAHAQWADSVHARSSFNNPVYAFSVRNTRQAMIDRFGSVEISRFCAGCHDPAILMTGAWGESRWTDPDLADAVAVDPLGSASIGCIVCHGIEDVTTLGNASYTFRDPPRYPFAFSDSGFLQWVNRQLILAKPDFHKRTFLKPVHQTAEFCGSCHKVFLPETLNGYKWLAGQNHYDTWRLSGVSGRGIGSWYWPGEISDDCNDCHMRLVSSDTVAAKVRDESGASTVHHHGFHAANTGLAAIASAMEPGDEATERLQRVVEACTQFNEDAIRLDLVGIRADGRVDGPFRGPIGESRVWVEPGEVVLLEAVTRTLRLGHPLTQGTADSNEIWIEIEVGLRPAETTGSLGASGMIGTDGVVDPRAKFLGVWLLDREGRRIEQRNPEDIFVPLYNHQIPPGAADLTHYRIRVPEDASGELEIRGRVRYRKFDSRLMGHAFGAEEGARLVKTLPILDLAETRVIIPVGSASTERVATTSLVAPAWERWNDYGIGLVRAGSGGGVAKGQLAQAIEAFGVVEQLGVSDGAINQGRAMLVEGRIDDAASALARAANDPDLRWPWAVDWYAAAVARENGDLEEAARRLERIIAARYPVAVERGYDFSLDERVWNEMATIQFQLARRAPTDSASAERLEEATKAVERSLELNSQVAQTWFLASTIRAASGDAAGSAKAQAEFELLRPDNNARDRAIRLARSRSEIADHAAEPLAIYELHSDVSFSPPAVVPVKGDGR